ncbi:GAF domain-containing protein [Geomonas subterranea]|uniref:histidine kinase n=1 Tax=Geomonas subterranea TaxID=2847989 RepID=A0ABX8LP06_9BACT|nr:GAF domain-containing protein [Geomonas subterranea]QXE91260.1 GAF domain-containing protein [Geomonas subterranea]QXM10653.1 GAF domain-containing protein [Geomonas subterranea]
MGDDPAKYHALFDQMAQGAFFQSADGTLTDVNPAALEMFGLTRDEFLGRTSMNPDWRVIAEDGSDLPPERHPSMAALGSGRPVRDFIAGVFNPRKRCICWFNLNALPMFRPGDSSPHQVFVTMHDISSHKRINDIHLSRIRLIQCAGVHPLDELMVQALDEVEKLTGSAIGFYHLFDAATGSVALKAWSTSTLERFCGIDDRDQHYSVEQAGVWADCLRSGKATIYNDYNIIPHRKGFPPGHTPVRRILVVPVQRNGEVVAILGVGNKPSDYTETDVHTVTLFADLTWDVAQQKQMQDRLLAKTGELKEANELLEQRVNQRTADLQAAIRERESFSYSVSHDLRAPLRHISSYSSILIEEYGPALPYEARTYLDRMRGAANQMGALIDHLLELSKVARAVISPEPIDLSAAAAGILQMLQETEPHRMVYQEIQPGLTTQGDVHLVNQLLGNLLGNAWKYTLKTPFPRIAVGKTTAAGEEVFFVTDNGAGFDMSYQSKLFKPFERLHGSEFDGVGIGLATSHQIVERHGGRIWGEGTVGRGATFYFTLGGRCEHEVTAAGDVAR